jgi:hypothetical protein
MSKLLEQLEFPQHVRQALSEGKLWRAKEILRGRIGSLPFSPDLYEQYGAVLLDMEDLLQAGKYLFLSGRRRPEYETSIDLFLSRYGKKSGKALADSFPSSVKALSLASLPENVQRELTSRGLPFETAQKSIGKASVSLRTKLTVSTALLGCIVVLLLAGASILAGVPIVLRYLWSLFR